MIITREDNRAMNLINFTDTAKKLGVHRATLYRLIKREPTFPQKRNPFGGQRSYFILEEVDQWIDDAMSEKA